ncbi:MAG: hypothetical protein ACP5QT_06570 [Brevinematia bacterium]
MNRLLSLILLFIPIFLYGAPIIRNPQPVEMGKISTGCFYELTSTNSILRNSSVSLGYGISEKMDVELFLYEKGLVFNLKPTLKEIDPFIVSGVMEVGIDFVLNFYWGLAIMMDLRLYDFLNIFAGAKGRFPANHYLDNTMREEYGFQLLPFLGFELFRRFNLSFISEGGFSLSWNNRLPSFYLSCGLRYKF